MAFLEHEGSIYQTMFPGNRFCRVMGIQGDLAVSHRDRKVHGKVVASFYNTGRRLYADPMKRFPGIFIDSKLKWLKFRDFCDQGNMVDDVLIATHGHRSQLFDSPVRIDVVAMRNVSFKKRRGKFSIGTTSVLWRFSLPQYAMCYFINSGDAQFLFVQEQFFLPHQVLSK